MPDRRPIDDHHQEHSMHHRTDDPPVKITREIPLPWLITAVAAVIVQALLMWTGQQEQKAAIAQLGAQMSEQTKQINALAERVGNGNLKDLEHDLKLNDFARRLADVESNHKGHKP